MINILKGSTLFISDWENDITFNNLVSFLSDEYTFLKCAFQTDIRTQETSRMKTLKISEIDYKEKISENLFRVEIIVVEVYRKIGNIQDFFDFLETLKLPIFLITDETNSLQILDKCPIHLKNIYKIEKEHSPYIPLNIMLIRNYEDIYFIKNINTDEEFTLNQYKKSYIRDKKINNLLDDNLEDD